MLEVYVLVPVKKTFAMVFLGILCFVLAAVSLFLTCIGGSTFGVLLIVFAALGYLFLFAMNKEFEYSYFDGEVRFAKVMNKSRRKRLAVYTMESVLQIAPAGDRSIQKYENDNTIKVKNYTSHVKGRAYYNMIINQNGQMIRIMFEPDAKYLDAVMVKYAQKVVRRQPQQPVNG